jgi:prophage DNA circulation protein
MKPTGITSTSFRIWLATFVPSVAAAITAFAQNSGGSKSAVLGGAGILSALFATLGKLFHDNGLNKASIFAAGSDIAKDLPELHLNLDKVLSFAESDFPGLQSDIASLTARITADEQKVVTAVPDSAAIEAVVRSVLAGIAPAPVVAPPA